MFAQRPNVLTFTRLLQEPTLALIMANNQPDVYTPNVSVSVVLRTKKRDETHIKMPAQCMLGCFFLAPACMKICACKSYHNGLGGVVLKPGISGVYGPPYYANCVCIMDTLGNLNWR